MSWPIAALGDVADIERRSISPSEIPSGSRYVGLEHIESGGASLSYGTVANGELASNKFHFGPNHILFGKLRPYLAKIVCPDFSGICSTDILPIAPGRRIDKHYLLHFLRRPQTVDWASVRSTGVNLPRLSPSELESLELPLPPLDEQRRIAAILDKADVLRRKRQRSLDLIREVASALAHKYLVGEEIELGDAIIEGPTNGLYKPSKDYGDGVPILRIDSFYDGRIVDVRSLKRLRASPAEIARFQLRVGDIVVNRVNSLDYLGKSALVRQLLEPTVFESNMMRLSLNSSLLLPEVCIALLQTSNVKRQVLSKAKNAVNQSSINQGDVRSLRIPLPEMDKQRRFLRGIEGVESIAERMIEGGSRSLSLISSLQHRAFSGQL